MIEPGQSETASGFCGRIPFLYPLQHWVLSLKLDLVLCPAGDNGSMVLFRTQTGVLPPGSKTTSNLHADFPPLPDSDNSLLRYLSDDKILVIEEEPEVPGRESRRESTRHSRRKSRNPSSPSFPISPSMLSSTLRLDQIPDAMPVCTRTHAHTHIHTHPSVSRKPISRLITLISYFAHAQKHTHTHSSTPQNTHSKRDRVGMDVSVTLSCHI